MYPTKKNVTVYIWIVAIAVLLTGCKKYLDAIPDKSLAIPQTIKELQGLLDYEENNTSFPMGTGFSTDDLYFTLADYNTIFFIDDRLSYIWDPNTDFSKDWAKAYQRIFKANVVLESLQKIADPNSSLTEQNNVKGSALFYRAFNFYELSQVFSPPYTNETANLEYGIPLKQTPDINDPTQRSTVNETYTKIITDLKEAIPLLPANTEYKTRPSKASAYALLARTYLVMNDYINAGKYADSSLSTYSLLMDYNDPAEVNVPANNPFRRLNKEVLFHAVTRNVTEMLKSKVDTLLYNSFDTNDIRKTAFFKTNADASVSFKGSYDGTGTSTLFCGIGTDEMYLLRAECSARKGSVSEAMQDLNTLLQTRWRQGTFIPYSATDQEDALEKILTERRKELCFRASLRWSDLRRLNLDNDRQVILKRLLDGKSYTLQPNDKAYTFLIPQSVIISSGIAQNPR